MTDSNQQQQQPASIPVPQGQAQAQIEQPNNPPDVAQNMDSVGQMIPYARFSEVNEKRKQAETELERYRQAERDREQQAAIQRGEFEKVINQLKPQVERLTQVEEALKGYLEAELADVPANMRDLVPQGDVTTQIAWIKQAKQLKIFTRTPAPNTDAGVTGDPKQATKLSDQEQAMAKKLGITVEQYAKNKVRN